MNKAQFIELAKIIVGKFESGYFDHQMFKDGRLKPDPKVMSIYRHSGETMYGIDRKAGAGIQAISPEAWRAFWGIIDREGWRTNPKIKWAYMGGNQASKLMPLAGEIMYPTFLRYVKANKITDQEMKLITSSPIISLHFAYGAWNGSGWFQKYINDFRRQVKAGKDLKGLEKSVIDFRLNSGNLIIERTGQKMKALPGAILKDVTGGLSGNLVNIIVLVAVIALIVKL